MLILLDQDGVLADFDRGFYQGWQRTYHEPAPIVADRRRHFYLRDDLPEEHHPRLLKLYTAPGFFATLPPVQGAVAAAQALLAHGHDVRICTSPITDYRNCVGEKLQWVEQHLGSDWVARVILTKDKTWVRGDILIDDKPEISGSLPPLWQHWLYDAPYNHHTATAKRVRWDQPETWQTLLAA